MVVSLQKVVRRLVFVLSLMLLTLLMFFTIRLLTQWVHAPDPYAVPQGSAVKVFGDRTGSLSEFSFRERLWWFYRIGE
ncbi:DUF4227 family protein [Paenibacillus tarimensis]|uniref:DUF4227 family protein n=1 Tax=Paenibacillus tarimensis TaxID=416012 RepID=UPI001F3A92D2|nr:DUF4227 family protein [Paenibacillus tarimensis]MCF2942471.1 YqzK family protein [Paenibacillus tarimensis]